MTNEHAALPTDVKQVQTRMYLRPIRGRSRWPRGQRVANGVSVGNSLTLGRVAQNARGVVKGVVKGVTRASIERRAPRMPKLKRASAKRREEIDFRGVYMIQ